MNKILGKLFLILTLLMPTVSLSAVDIIVRTDRNPVHIDESFQLIFEANGSVDDDPDFSSLKILLDVLRQSENSSISLINGSMSRSKTWTLTVMAKVIGDIQIPVIHFGDDSSLPLLISVKKVEQAQMGNASFSVNLDSDVKSSMVQAQIIATVRVFSDKSLNEISLSSLQFNHGDVVIEILGDEKSFQTKIQGKAYLVIEQKIAIFPQKPGPLVIQPVLALAEVKVGAKRFFGGPVGKPVRARSDSLSIDIQAKPDVSLWLPAKSLTLVDKWLSDPSQFTVGEPITRVLTLTAHGLTAAQLPELDVKKLNSVKMYPDQEQLKNTISSNGIIGIRQEKIAYIPSKSGEFKLPSMEIPWWNTQTGQWEKAQIPEQIITVKPSALLIEQAPIVTKVAPKLETKESSQESVLALMTEPPVLKSDEFWWKWIALFFALAWLLTLWLLFKKRDSKALKNKVEKSVKPVFNSSDLKIACKDKDARACMNCVLSWANAQSLDQSFTQLSDLKDYVDDDFYALVKQLESLLYSSESNSTWDPDLLYQTVINADFNKKDANKVVNKNLKSMHLS